MRRRRRRCGPPVWHPRVPSPWHRPPTDLDCRFDGGGGGLTAGPLQRSIMAAVLLFVSSSWSRVPRHTHVTHPRTTGTTRVSWRGARQGTGSTSASAAIPSGDGDIVSRVWALSPPGTTEGRRLAGRSQSGHRGPRTKVVEAPLVPKRRRPLCQSGGGPGGPKAAEAPGPKRSGTRWSQSGRGPRPNAAGAPVVPKGRRPPPQCGGGLGGPKAAGDPWFQSGGGPRPNAARALMVPKRRRPGPNAARA